MKHKMLFSIAAMLITSFAITSTLIATPISLTNPGFEVNTSPKFGVPDGWGPNGGWADHAGFAKPGYVAAMQTNFCFMSAQTAEIVGQSVPPVGVFEANKIYKFWSYAMGGGDDVGEIAYEIGYTNESGGFITLAGDTALLDGTWVETAGVTYNAGASGPELGQAIAVRFGDGVGVPESSDVWFDVAQLDVVPEPATIGLLALLAGFFLRKIRK